MRDHLVQAWDAVDVNEIWNTIQSDLPRLITWLEARGSLLPRYVARPPARCPLRRRPDRRRSTRGHLVRPDGPVPGRAVE